MGPLMAVRQEENMRSDHRVQLGGMTGWMEKLWRGQSKADWNLQGKVQRMSMIWENRYRKVNLHLRNHPSGRPTEMDTFSERSQNHHHQCTMEGRDRTSKVSIANPTESPGYTPLSGREG